MDVFRYKLVQFQRSLVFRFLVVLDQRPLEMLVAFKAEKGEAVMYLLRQWSSSQRHLQERDARI